MVMPMTLLSTGGYLIGIYAATGLLDIRAGWIVALSQVPLVSPFMMLGRIATDVAAPWEIVLSVALLVVVHRRRALARRADLRGRRPALRAAARACARSCASIRSACSRTRRRSVAPTLSLAALVAQEPLDVGDEVVPRRQPLLVVHRLEPLDVAPGRLVEPGRRVEPAAQLARLGLEIVGRDRRAEVVAERPQQLDGRRRVGPGHVVRDLREVAEGRDAGRGDLELEGGHEGRRDPQHAGRAGRHVAAQQAGRRLRARGSAPAGCAARPPGSPRG